MLSRYQSILIGRFIDLITYSCETSKPWFVKTHTLLFRWRCFFEVGVFFLLLYYLLLFLNNVFPAFLMLLVVFFLWWWENFGKRCKNVDVVLLMLIISICCCVYFLCFFLLLHWKERKIMDCLVVLFLYSFKFEYFNWKMCTKFKINTECHSF